MKTTYLFRNWMIFEALLYIAEASSAIYIYYQEESTVLLKCQAFEARFVAWWGPVRSHYFREILIVDMHGNHKKWNTSMYSRSYNIIPDLPHRNRFQVIWRKYEGTFLQTNNASIFDEGLYFCQDYFHMDERSDYYLLKLINASRTIYKYYPEKSTILLKCSLNMEWFGHAYSYNSFNQSPVNDMHGKRSFWTVNRYTEGKSISPSLPHHNRLKVIRRQQTGENELQIRNTSLLDEGLYFCDDSEMPTVSDYYILHLINRTVVLGMHDMIEEINEGETKKFCCYLDSKQTLTSLKWLKGKKTVLVTQNGNESCYTIMRVTRYDEGIYTCLAENIIASGSVTVVLKVKYKPQVSIKKDLIENVNEGETKKLCCCIESYPSPTVTRWLKGSQERKVAYNVTDVCYTINNISRYDQGIYICTAENIVGNGSSSTVLQVKYKPLVSSMQDSIEEINEGETKKLCCFVDSNPTSKTTRWFNGSQETLVTHNVNKTCYTITSVNRYDQGNYTCIAENIIGMGSVSVILIVNYKPEVSIKHDFSEDVHEGGTKILCCYVDSNPSPTSIRWFNRSQEISVINSVTENCYTIKNVGRYDQGNYTCTAENIIGSGSVRTVLKVKYKPLVLIKHDLIDETNEGETKTLCCYADSNPAPTSTRWFNENKEMSVTHNGTDTCCTIEKVSRYDSGVYTCTAENIIGIGSLATVLKVKYKPVVSRKHDLIEEIHEGETKNLCCYVDSNTAITSTRWFNGSQEIFIKHYVTETSSPTSTKWFEEGQEIGIISNATAICYTIKNVSRYDQGIYTCTAENIVGSGSITIVLQVKSNYQLKENAQPLQSVVLWGLLGTIAVLVVGIAILFFHMKQKKKQRILSTINLGSQRGNDDESGHYMEIYMIDESIVTPLQENRRPIIATVERSIVETRDIAPISAGHSSTSSDNDRNAPVYLEDGYEHPYNTLLAYNRDEDEHVYLTPIKTSNNENATPSENAACGCSYELTEQDSLPDQSKTHCEENDCDKNNESEI